MDWKPWRKPADGGPGDDHPTVPGSGVEPAEENEPGNPSLGNPGPEGENEKVEGSDAKDDKKTCPKCGSEVEANSKFCNQCAAPLDRFAEEAARKEELEAIGLKPWAVKLGAGVSRIPTGVKIGIPLATLIIVALLVSLFAIAAGHSPASTVERYLSRLKDGDYQGAYELVYNPGGKFSSFEYFKRWQDIQSDELGPLQDFRVKPRKVENRLFGRLLSDPVEGTPYTVTMIYSSQTYDVNITAVDAGGVWPANKYRLKLSEEPTRVFVSVKGAEVYVDGELVGKATEDKELEEALSLRELPEDFDGAIDYVRKLLRVFENLVGEVKRLARSLDNVVEDASRVFDKFGASGVTWAEVTDTVDRMVENSKAFGADVVSDVMNIYWMFGGGDDGSLRSELSRTRNRLDLNNLPEGFHKIEVTLPGAKAVKKDFHAPEDVNITLKPTKETEKELKGNLEAYYHVIVNAMSTLDASQLPNVLTGELLEEEQDEIDELVARGQRIMSELKSREFEKFKMYTETVATVETKEKWSHQTYEGQALISTRNNVKQDVTYTLEKEKDGTWKVSERKIEGSTDK